MSYARLVIAVLAARFFVTAISYPHGDGDLGWQRWLGATILRTGAIPRALGAETFSAPGAPWVPQEWAFAIAASQARGGLAWAAFAGASALCAALALELAARRALRLGGSPRSVALCAALGGIGIFAAFGVRAQVAAWPLAAGFALLLELESPWALCAIPLAALWSNLHASAVLAPVLAGLAAAGAALDARRVTPQARRLAIVAAGSALAVCANPFGVGLPVYAVTLVASPFKAYIAEWAPPRIGDASFAFGALPLLALALVLAGPGPRRARDGLTVAALAVLTLSAVRNVALFGLLAAPPVAARLARLRAFAPPERAVATAFSRFGLPVLGCVVCAIVGLGLLADGRRGADTVASGAIAAAVALPGEHRLACEDFAWCGFAVGAPRVRVFLDGRADPYPAAVWADAATLARLEPGWRGVLDRRGIDAVATARGSPLDQALAAVAPRWRLAYGDAGYRLWLRTP